MVSSNTPREPSKATSVTLRTPPALTRADRCDRCSARALVRVLFPAGELLFCGHHARAHEERLSEIGATLTVIADW